MEPEPPDDGKMTEQRWKEELALAIHEPGLPWQVLAAGCVHEKSTVFAHVYHLGRCESKLITVSTDRSLTDAARQVEIVRQLSA